MAIFDESTLGLPPNQLVFNRFTDEVIFRAERIRVSGRDLRQFDSPLPERNGISDFKTLIGKVDYVFDGEMYPRDQSLYEQGRRLLRRVADVANRQLDDEADNGYVPYVWDETDQDKQLFMKVLFVDLPEDTDNGLVQAFRLYCKIKNPVIKGTILRLVDTGGASGVLIGVVGFPTGFPALLGKSFYQISTSADNQGDIAAYPESIVINGPINRPRLTLETTGEFIEVDVNMATIADELIIRYDPDSNSVELNGVPVFNKVTNDSDFFKLPPGLSNFQLSGLGMEAGARARISFYDAWPLS